MAMIYGYGLELYLRAVIAHRNVGQVARTNVSEIMFRVMLIWNPSCCSETC